MRNEYIWQHTKPIKKLKKGKHWNGIIWWWVMGLYIYVCIFYSTVIPFWTQPSVLPVARCLYQALERSKPVVRRHIIYADVKLCVGLQNSQGCPTRMCENFFSGLRRLLGSQVRRENMAGQVYQHSSQDYDFDGQKKKKLGYFVFW